MKPGNWLIRDRVLYQSQLFVLSNNEVSDELAGQLNEHHREIRKLMQSGVGGQEATP